MSRTFKKLIRVLSLLFTVSSYRPTLPSHLSLHVVSTLLIIRALASSQTYVAQMPHPLRALAGDRMMYSVPINVFLDDVSGNISKQWNKHFSCYISNGLLPREKLMEEFHVRFVATSPTATPLEIMQGVQSFIECVTFLHIQRS